MTDRKLRVRTALVALTVGVTAYLTLWPVPIDPVVWHPTPGPGLTGQYAPNSLLADIEHLVQVGPGPEDMTRGPDGLIYTGLEDGRIVRFDPDSGAPAETFVDTGGRPLGLEFSFDNELIVADAFRGLLSISPDGNVTVLVDSIGGERMMFVNDVDIAVGGTIWFTDSSQRFDQRNYMLDMIEGRATGRLLSYDPDTSETKVWMEDLRFANGVATGARGSYVWVAEMLEARVHELVVGLDRARRTRIMIDEIPGYPDNLSWNGDGIVWVALPSRRTPPLENLANSPFLRKVLLRIPGMANIPVEPYSFVIGIDEEGNVVHNLQAPAGAYPSITSVKEIDGYLYFGSIFTDSIGRMPVPSG